MASIFDFLKVYLFSNLFNSLTNLLMLLHFLSVSVPKGNLEEEIADLI